MYKIGDKFLFDFGDHYVIYEIVGIKQKYYSVNAKNSKSNLILSLIVPIEGNAFHTMKRVRNHSHPHTNIFK